MNEPKSEDVMKALELHADCETDNCFECPYENYLSKADGNCVHHLSMDALALLREKDAEIERLTSNMNGYAFTAQTLSKEFEDYRADVQMEIADARAEAITEFAERLKSEVNGGQFASYKGLEIRNVIDQIEKEMKEGKR